MSQLKLFFRCIAKRVLIEMFFLFFVFFFRKSVRKTDKQESTTLDFLYRLVFLGYTCNHLKTSLSSS